MCIVGIWVCGFVEVWYGFEVVVYYVWWCGVEDVDGYIEVVMEVGY